MDRVGTEEIEDAPSDAFPSALERTLAAVERTPIRLGRSPSPRPAAASEPAPDPTESPTPPAEPTTPSLAPEPPAATDAPAPTAAPTAPEPADPQAADRVEHAAPATPIVVPTLPSAAPPPVSPSLATGGHLAGMTHHQAAALQSGTALGTGRRRSRAGARVGATVLLMMLAALLGGGARYGLDWYDRTEAADRAADAAGDNAELAVGVVDPPAWQYVVVEATGSDAVDQFDLRSQANLRDGFQVVEVSRNPSVAGEPSSFTVDRRGERIAVGDGTGAWFPVDEATASDLRPLLDNFGLPWVLTLSDLVPPASLPFVTIVDRSEEVLDIEPLDDPAPAADRGAAGTAVRRFVLRRDDDAYRAAELATYRPWTVGAEAVDVLELWIDEQHVVRRLHAVSDVDSVTLTWTQARRTTSDFPPAPPVQLAGLVGAGG